MDTTSHGPPPARGEDARRIKAALADLGAETLCTELGLCQGPPRRERGTWWRESGGVKVSCPVHGDRTPSCSVVDRGDGIVWHCHACGAGGSGVDLVAVVQGIDAKRAFREALDASARVAGVPDTRGAVAARSTPLPRRAPVAPVERFDPEVFARIADVILTDPLTALDRHVEPPSEREACACGCVDVRRYLEDRGILHLASRDGWRSLPTHQGERVELVKHIVAAVGRAQWEASPLVWARSSGEVIDGDEFKRKHHRLIVPWRTRGGACTALQRRLLLGVGERHCVACDQRAPCKLYPHRRLLTDPQDERIPASERGAVAGSGKYENAGEVVEPYGAHRLGAEVERVAFVEGAVDALSYEARKHSLKGEAWVALALGSTGTWLDAWRELGRGREVVIGLDADAKPKTREVVDNRRRQMKRDLEGVARTVDVKLPHLDGREAEKVDWSDVWCALRR